MADGSGAKIEVIVSRKSHYSTVSKLLSRQLSRQEVRHRSRSVATATVQGKVYNFLERPLGVKCLLYHTATFSLVLACLALSVLSTTTEMAALSNGLLYWMEAAMVAFFGAEYCLRMWSAGCRGKYVGVWGRLRYVRKTACVIDLIVFAASLFVLACGSDGQVFATSAIRGIRFLQMLRMLRVDRRGGTWRLLGSVIYAHRQELITTLYIGFLGLVFSSYFVYLAERGDGDESEFRSFADALWWGVATFTTIGYGDKVPRTWTGRAITCFFSLVIISFITLPSGILGSGFALIVQQKQRQKHFTRQFPAAALLIQAAWRCHAVEKNAASATWKVHLCANCSVATTTDDESGRFFLRKRLLKRSTKAEAGSTTPEPRNGGNANSAYEDNDATEAEDSTADDDERSSPKTLTQAYRHAIRAVCRLKFLSARRHFEQARKPYDVQDVIEQYSQGHLNMMFRLKELQRRLERTFGKAPHGDKSTTISARLNRLEHKVGGMDRKLDQVLSHLQTTSGSRH